MAQFSETSLPHIVGRYAVYGRIASGGMATVHLGRLLGPVGFSRTVAIKRMLPHFAEDPEFVSMFLDEARLAARIRHPNVVPTLDVVAAEGELFLVMEYIQGETLARLLHRASSAGIRIPIPVVASIVCGALHGLHAAHEARNEQGEPLGIVHRDVSPQNIMVSIDGNARVLDFGVAKAAGRLHTTRSGQLKGKIPYMAPELLKGGKPTRRSDVFSASVVLWEVLTGERLFDGENDAVLLNTVTECKIEPPSRKVPGLAPGLDAIVMRGLDRQPEGRFATTRAMASALEACVRVAIPSVVGAWVEQIAGESIAQQAAQLMAIENGADVTSDVGQSVRSLDPADAMTTVPGSAGSGKTEAPLAAAPAPVASADAPATNQEPDFTSLSQISSISVSSSVFGGMERQRRVAVAIGSAVAAALATIAMVAWLMNGSPSAGRDASALAASGPSPRASTAIATPGADTTESPAASASAQTPDPSTTASSAPGKKKPVPPVKGGVMFRNPG